ncbi:hypothetical protein K2W90_06350 [Candidatus Babeliales bacterium]|nr:hypothetical protein [Candidatus Babeliales bacterium]
MQHKQQAQTLQTQVRATNDKMKGYDMKLFKQSIVFSLFLCLSAGHANVYAAASSVLVEPAIKYHDSGLPTRLADYLAETPFFKWLGNKITTYALEAHEARKENAKKYRRALVRKQYAKQYIKTGKPGDIESFRKELGECEKALPEYHPTSSEYYPTSSATLAPKTFGQWALVIMCITAPFLPQNNCPFDDQKDEIPELSEAGKEIAGLARYGRKHRFDVCHERPGDLRQCCTIHDNTRIECCLISSKDAIEICQDLRLRGYPKKIHVLDIEGLEDFSPITPPYDKDEKEANGYHGEFYFTEYRLFQDMLSALTTTETAELSLIRSGCDEAAYYPGKVVELSRDYFEKKAGFLMLPLTMAHELGHHQQRTNNQPLAEYFLKMRTTSTKFTSHDLRAFNNEFNADLHSYLLVEPNKISRNLLLFYDARFYPEFLDKKGYLMIGLAQCPDVSESFLLHPDSITCRMALFAELHEKYPFLVQELKEKMAAALSKQEASASSGAASSSSSN